MTLLINELRRHLPADRVVDDELRRIAYGTDASFYRLVPQAIVFARDESDVRSVLAVCRALRCPVTFRAAGTSLSGQAVTNGTLVVFADGWTDTQIENEGLLIRLGPGVIGAEANRLLAPLGRKIGPDPASINACKIGGIAANNASGMCCGTAQNSYRTLASMRLMLADGTLLDTADQASVDAFRQSHADFLAAVDRLARGVRVNATLAARIRHKYRLKNTTGYSLNALIDFDDPVDIVTHLMIGSEGTLGFMSRIDYHTVPEHSHKASALMLFGDLGTACRAVVALKSMPVAAVELLDRASIRSVEQQPGVPEHLRALGPDAAALLVETRAETATTLDEQLVVILATLAPIPLLEPPHFSKDKKECERLWNVRKGVFPSVGAMRKPGTTVLIEDVAFPVERLAEATLDLEHLMHAHGYNEGVIYGHALDGNLHFIFTQDFGDSTEVTRYGRFMDAVSDLVVNKYDGSLKAEHGTGRNMAPFVEMEWGQEATALMYEIKRLFDPQGLLNPDVILSTDRQLHLKNLKPMPKASPLVDSCIECGFCEPMCPSAGLTFSPRQRITSTRAVALARLADETPSGWQDSYRYNGMDTCAGCGMCSTVCPVGINTGDLIRQQRSGSAGPMANHAAHWLASHFALTAAAARVGLRLGHVAEATVGQDIVSRLSGGAWRDAGLRAAPSPTQTARVDAGESIVYFPGCAGRIFASGGASLADTIVRLCEAAGYRVIQPANRDELCCGQPFKSKGLFDAAQAKAEELERALAALSDGGRRMAIFDASACALRMKEHVQSRLPVLDFIEFAHDHLLPKLRFKRKPEIALHINCGARRMQLADQLRGVAQACAERVIEPIGIQCCGFGGDRGFAVPELNAHALRRLAEQIPSTCTEGYSSNLTCEIGLTEHAGIPYRSIAHLMEESLLR